MLVRLLVGKYLHRLGPVRYLLVAAFSITGLCSSAQTKQPADYVDPFIGTENKGNVFPGPSLPFGMVRVSPDCKSAGKSPNTNSGYETGMPVYGFSQTHVSGTGGGAKYGNILLMPVTGTPVVKDHISKASNEHAGAGYYSVTLDRYKVTAELTATHSVGIHRYTFNGEGQPSVMVDAASFLIKGSTIQRLVSAGIKVTSPAEAEGFGTVKGGWNEGAPYTVYFYLRFDKGAGTTATWRNGVISEAKQAYPLTKTDSSATGAVFTFASGTKNVVAKVGISFVSIQKAKQNLLNEAAGKSFDELRMAAKATWNNLLKRVQVTGNNAEDKKKMFYTALYHVMLMPSDRTGENPLWKSGEPYYDDYYAIWDTYRASNPLITLIDVKRQEDIIRSLIDIYKHEGYMPDARSGNYNGLIQSGTNSDMLIADAWVKGLKNIDYKTAYQSMVKNAETEPENPKKEGRAGISFYNTIGYVPTSVNIAGSRTMEYCNNDAAIATVAKGLGYTADHLKYKKRASNWQNLWRNVTYDGSTGFIWPKDKNGQWEEGFNVKERGTFKKGFLYEGDTWTYSLYVPQDVKKLIELSGGNAAFINRLDTFFSRKYYDVNNEPGFLTPCLYTWAGRPDKVSLTVRDIIKTHYSAKPGGLPGNDDSGAMSGWLAMNMMGFYPNAGQDVYLITAPAFSKTVIQLGDHKSLIITANNLNNENIYVQSAKLNGKPLNRAWFRHKEIVNGANLELAMGSKPSDWGTSVPPPSLTD
jgi:predicted alpha-1,2-mannosidase